MSKEESIGDQKEDLVKLYDERYRGDYMGDFVKGGYEFRRRKMVNYIINKLNLKPKTILDYGCGQGKYIGVLKNAFSTSEINGCDISKVAIEKANIRYPAYKFIQFEDVTPYENNTFDFILSIEVFEHVEDIDKTLKDIARILKPGGYILFSTPCANPFSLEYMICVLKRNGIQPSKEGFRRFYFEDPGHIRRLKSKEISTILKDNGLEEVFFLYHCHFFAALQWMYGDKLRLTRERIMNRKGVKRKLIIIIQIPFQPIVFLLDFLGWIEWVLFKKLPNGSTMFGVFKKR